MKLGTKIVKVLVFVSLLFITLEAGEHTGHVQIVNKTGKKIMSVTLVHKYSNVYKTKHTWKNIKKDGITSTKHIHYNTGIATTGRDWWAVSWVDEKGTAHISNPKNFQGVLNVFEDGAFYISGALFDAGLDVLVTDPEPYTKLIGAAVTVTSAMGLLLYNTESTAGFKQHILRSKNTKGQKIRIELHNDKIYIKSYSGKSETGVKKCKPQKGSKNMCK